MDHVATEMRQPIQSTSTARTLYAMTLECPESGTAEPPETPTKVMTRGQTRRGDHPCTAITPCPCASNA